MRDIQNFGSPGRRSAGGGLLAGEVERIKNFLRYGGVLLVEVFDRWVVMAHPALIDKVIPEKSGFSRLFIGASLDAIYQELELTVTEVRLFEAFGPGPLVLEKSKDGTSCLVTLSERIDLRDVAAVFNGLMVGFSADDPCVKQQFIERVDALVDPAVHIGLLDHPDVLRSGGQRPTIVRADRSGTLAIVGEGAIDLHRLNSAVTSRSEWELGEWT